MFMTYDGYVMCPRCNSEVRVGRFYESEGAKLEPGVEQLETYYSVDIFRVECWKCRALFNASELYGATLFYVTPDK